MILQEPKVEFVSIDVNIVTDDTTATSYGGGQRCVGSQPEATPCANFETSIPW